MVYHHHRDPVVIGPGVWAFFHSISRHANTVEEYKKLIPMIILGVETFGCLKCREHGIKYIETQNPIWNVLKDKRDFALFLWTVDFHNQANKYTNKSQISYESAMFIWSENTICREDCGEEEKEIERRQSNIQKLNSGKYKLVKF